MDSSTSQHLDDLKESGWKCPGKNSIGEDLPWKFNDKETLLYYPNLKEITGASKCGVNPGHYLYSIQHSLTFFEAIGLGALKTMQGNGRGTITLSEASRFCLTITKKKRSDTQYLKVKKQTQEEYNDHVKHWNSDHRKYMV
jgi:hypothetical protein